MADTPGTRDRIMEAAMYLFWEKGFASTSVDDLLERANCRSGSFYHFFRSKEALLYSVLELYAKTFASVIVEPAFAITADPIGRIFAILAHYRERLLLTDCTYGCPIGRLALEVAPENSTAFQLIGTNFSVWRAAIESCLIEAPLPPETSISELASFVLTVMEGSVMQARTFRSIEPFDAGVNQLRTYLDLLVDRTENEPEAMRS